VNNVTEYAYLLEAPVARKSHQCDAGCPGPARRVRRTAAGTTFGHQGIKRLKLASPQASGAGTSR